MDWQKILHDCLPDSLGKLNEILSGGGPCTTPVFVHDHDEAGGTGQKDLVVIGSFGKVEAFDLNTLVQAWQYPLQSHPSQLVSSPDGKLLAVGTWDDLHLLEAMTGKLVWKQKVHRITALPAFSPEKPSRHVVVGNGSILTRYQVATGESEELAVSNHQINAGAAYTHDGLFLLFGGSNQAYSSKGLLIAGSQHYLNCLNLQNEKLAWKFRVGAPIAAQPILSPCGQYAFVGATDNNVYCVRMSDGGMVWAFRTEGEVVSKVAISPDGRFLIAGDKEGAVYGIDPYTTAEDHKTRRQSPNELWRYHSGAPIQHSIVFSREGKLAAIPAGRFFTVLEAETGSGKSLFNADNGEPWKPYEAIGKFFGVAAFPYDNVFVTPSSDGLLHGFTYEEVDASYSFPLKQPPAAEEEGGKKVKPWERRIEELVREQGLNFFKHESIHTNPDNS